MKKIYWTVVFLTIIALISVILIFFSYKRALNRNLFKAIVSGDEKRVSQILARGADVNAMWTVNLDVVDPYFHKKDGLFIPAAQFQEIHGMLVMCKEKVTPLQVAAILGKKEIAALLISKGADVNAKDSCGISVMFDASYYGHSEIVERLIKSGADVKSKPFTDMTYLSLAAEVGNTDVVNVLLEAGADVNVIVGSGSTPLHLASNNGHADIVKRLIEAGACEKVIDNDKNEPVHTAALGACNPEVLRLLLSKGADVNAKGMNGMTPLHCMANNGKTNKINTEFAFILLSSGANVNTTDDNKMTPLHYACKNAKNEFAKILLSSGADPAVKDNSGKTAFDYIEDKKLRDDLVEKPEIIN